MKVSCSSCGEELLGSVNRCWRCGTELVSRPGADQEPPLRQAPVAAIEAATADQQEIPTDGTGADAPSVHSSDVSGEEPDSNGGSNSDDVSAAAAVSVESAESKPESNSPEHEPTDFIAAPRPTHYPQHTAAAGGAIAALLLALMSLAGAYFTVGAVLTALLGIALGAWGIYSNYRALAVIAMLLCLIAMFFGSAFGAINLYTEMHGRSPFDPAPLFEDEYEEYRDDIGADDF